MSRARGEKTFLLYFAFSPRILALRSMQRPATRCARTVLDSFDEEDDLQFPDPSSDECKRAVGSRDERSKCCRSGSNVPKVPYDPGGTARDERAKPESGDFSSPFQSRTINAEPTRRLSIVFKLPKERGEAMSQNGYTYGGHHPAHHPNNSPLINNQTPNSATYSMPPLQPGVPLLSTGPLGGSSTSGHLSHGLPSLGQQSTLPPPGAPASSHHPLSFYGDPYAGPYTPVAQQQQQQHHYAPQYVPRPISAASNHHHSPAPPNSSSVINSVTHSQQPGAAGPSAVAAAGLPIAADGSTHSNTAGSTPPPPPVTKARSSVACALCRKQKASRWCSFPAHSCTDMGPLVCR